MADAKPAQRISQGADHGGAGWRRAALAGALDAKRIARRRLLVGGGGKGTQTLIGGTGKYAGITGTCEYTVEYLPDNRIVTQGSCDWQRN